jgi:hypothetical protein
MTNIFGVSVQYARKTTAGPAKIARNFAITLFFTRHFLTYPKMAYAII